MPAPEHAPDAASDFAARYERIAPALCVWAMRHVGHTIRSRVEVDDVLQEVWLRAFRQRRQFTGDDGGFRAWMFAIAKMVLLEVHRSVQRLQRMQIGDGRTSRLFALDGVEASVTRLTQRLVRDDAVRRFFEHTARLPREDQELLSFCGLEGATCAEAARKLGIGADAATKRWQRLRARLREEGLVHDWAA